MVGILITVTCNILYFVNNRCHLIDGFKLCILRSLKQITWQVLK